MTETYTEITRDARGKITRWLVSGDPRHLDSWEATHDDRGNRTSRTYGGDPKNPRSFDYR